jgi:hypothetical protein
MVALELSNSIVKVLTWLLRFEKAGEVSVRSHFFLLEPPLSLFTSLLDNNKGLPLEKRVIARKS